MHTTLICY